MIVHYRKLLLLGCTFLVCGHAGVSDAGQADFQPFDTRDQNLFNLIHGQPTPTNGSLIHRHDSLVTTTLVTTNTLNIESRGGESIYLDYESYRLNLSWQYGIDDNWNLKLDIPYLRQTGGYFDQAIDDWHRFWGFPRANRPYVENNRYFINYSTADSSYTLDETNSSIGDIQLAIARQLLQSDQQSLGLWGALKFPTGNENRLSGNGSYDYSAWLSYNRKLADSWLMNLNSGLVLPGANDYQGLSVSDHVFFGSLMVNWHALESLGIKLQLQGHTRYYDQSSLKILGDTYFLTFGSTIRFGCSALDIAMSEDIKVDASPDTSLVISWRHQFADASCNGR